LLLSKKASPPDAGASKGLFPIRARFTKREMLMAEKIQTNGRNMYVFRDGRHRVLGATLVRELAERIQGLATRSELFNPISSDFMVDALLRAGELECALRDAGSAEAGRMECLTDQFAKLLLAACCSRPDPLEMLDLLPREIPAELQLSPPEGFAYYSLHPLDFADLAAGAEISGGYAAVVGIRSIGTTLSAVVLAALHKRGVHAERMTVRPTGHPYRRHTGFSPEQLRWIAEQRALQADFLVVDEGPGMSGSSLLSVGEALLGAGVPRARIQFLCSRQPDLHSLCAENAARRWSGFRFRAAQAASRLPEDAQIYIGGGYWRYELLGEDPAAWPASWSQMEKMKFLSADRRRLIKFEGLGRFGEEIYRRAVVLGDAGFAPPPAKPANGFGCYPFLDGTILTPADVDREVLERMAEYCAFRRCAFAEFSPRYPLPGDDSLQTMVRFNLMEEFGVDVHGSLSSLAGDNPVLVDGRMLPHKWLRTREGRLIKCDGTAHGDDHFFPGPATDIAWDLAGVIVEWNLANDHARVFLEHYRVMSGDDPHPRLATFLLAYAIFRCAYCKMAATAMAGSEEEPRLLNAYRYYRELAATWLPQSELLAAD